MRIGIIEDDEITRIELAKLLNVRDMKRFYSQPLKI